MTAAGRAPGALRRKFESFSSLLNLRPLDQASEEGRARERQRRIAMSAVASLMAKVTSVGTSLLSIPLTLHYLGPERFGMWMAISSFIAMMSFADFGIGNGVLNAVAHAYGKSDDLAIRKIISSGLFALSCLGLAIWAVALGAYHVVDWPRLFNVKSAAAASEAAPAFMVLATIFCANILLGVFNRAQMALQQSFISSLFQCVGSLTSLAAILLAVSQKGSLPLLVGALAGGPLVASVLSAMFFFSPARASFRPKWSLVSLHLIKEIVAGGMFFFVLQIVMAVTFTSDNLLITRILGPTAVAQYAVPEKLFSVIPMLLGMILAPLWPAYREALARGDAAWVRHTLLRSLRLAGGCAALMSVTLLLLAPFVIPIWIGHSLDIPFSLIAGFALWKIVETTGGALAMFLNGANAVKIQVTLCVLMAAAALSLKILFTGRFGIAAVPWSTLTAYTLFSIIPYIFILPRMAVFRKNNDRP